MGSILGDYVMSLRVDELRVYRPPRPKWECRCGKQCTRQMIVDGKKIVICKTCHEVMICKNVNS